MTPILPPKTVQRRAGGPRSASVRGVTLIIVMVMLVIIGLASASVMRSTVASEEITNNSRNQALASLMAEAALRYCERGFQLPAADPQFLDPWAALPAGSNPAQRWESFAMWHGSTKIAVDVPREYLESREAGAESSKVVNMLPQCLVEMSTLPAQPAQQVVVITGRGFSPDYTEDDAGKTLSGSSMWSQVTLRLSP